MTLLLTVILVALVFEYINGFHDTANSIATVVSTKVLTPRQAILLAATTNLVGALVGHAVAKTVSSGLVDSQFVTNQTIVCALLGGIVWNLLTWWLGLPSSSTHALVGGLCGATLASAQNNWKAILWSVEKVDKVTGAVKHEGILHKVIVPMFSSPIIGFVVGFLLMNLLYVMLRNARPAWVNAVFGKLQLASASYMGFAHGLADAQKTMGIITLALVTATTAGSLEGLPKALGFLRMDKTRIAELQIVAMEQEGSDYAQAARILSAEADKLKTGEFKEAFHALSHHAFLAAGDAAAAERELELARSTHSASVAYQASRLLPKVPLLGKLATVKPSDWLQTLEGEKRAAVAAGKPVLVTVAKRVQSLAPDVPVWIKVVCALTMAAGTAAGGWKIIKTMGHKMVKLQPVHGFAAETTAATVLAVTGQLGMTVSTTHAITTSIMGVGCAKRFSALKLNVVERILWAWVFTLPATGLMAYGLMRLVQLF
jgi:phosphate/sulfate permease